MLSRRMLQSGRMLQSSILQNSAIPSLRHILEKEGPEISRKSVIFASMKWKSILIAIALLAVIGLQCFWLFRQYSTQHARLRQQLDDAIAECDYEELLVRGRRLYHNRMTAEYTFGEQDKQQEQLWRSIHIERKGNIVKKTIVEKYRVVKNSATNRLDKGQTLPLDTVKSHPFASIIKEIRVGMHQVLDTVAVPEVHTFYNLLATKMAAYGLDTEMRVELWKDKRSVAHPEGIDYNPRHAVETGRLQWETDGHTWSYRVRCVPLGWIVLSNMAGIIGLSVVVILLLLVVFWMLGRTIRKLQAVDEMKSDFVNNMTHELKTPVSVAYAANDALLNFGQSLPKEKRTEYLKIALQQLKKLGQLVEQILQMTMERRTTLQLDMQQVDVSPIVGSLVEEYRLKADKPVAFHIVGGDNHPMVFADAAQLQHVLGNLIDNALKYSGTTVDITISLSDGVITVADNGIGIAKEKLDYIFDKFYRVPQGNLHDVKGYGLGLYYVRNIMERMDGEVSVRSTLGKGTEFTLRFKENKDERKDKGIVG